MDPLAEVMGIIAPSGSPVFLNNLIPLGSFL